MFDAHAHSISTFPNSYLSVLHNKDEGEGIHSYLHMFEKILAEEIKMRCEIKPGPPVSDLRSQEFSRNHIMEQEKQ